jgi:hypothetical protein
VAFPYGSTAGQVGGFFCNVLFGYLVVWTNSYNAPVLVIAALVFVSSLLFLGINPSRPLDGTAEAEVIEEAT